MKKVGVLTFHRAVNYGAVLQAYALCRQIKKLGAECKIIDYYRKYHDQIYNPFSIDKRDIMKSLMRTLLTGKAEYEKRKSFCNFVKKYIDVTPPVYDRSDLTSLNKDFDLFITGSDQVWNNACNDFDSAYFLDFVEDAHKKNSYAASFGFDKIPNESENMYRSLLKDFNHISVREESGNNIVQRLLRRSVHVDLDPTLLLLPDDWKSLTYELKRNQDYILIYTVMQPYHLPDAARNLAKKSGLKIIYLNAGLKMWLKNLDFKFIFNASPEDFLTLFQNAKYVFTNSFHGTVFSIIFHRQFWVEFQFLNGRENDRSKHLLKLLGLSDRGIMDTSACKINDIIQWDDVDQRLLKERKKSLDYLESILTL